MKINSLRKWRISLILGILLSLATILFVLSKLDWKAVGETLAGTNWFWLGLALCVYLLNYLFRAFRLQMINDIRGVPILELLALNGLYGMYNYLLPAKSGEMSYIILLNRRLKLSLADSTASLLVARYLDFASIALFLPFVLVYYKDKLPVWLFYASLAFCGLALLLTIGLYLFIRPRSDQSQNGFNPLRVRWLSKINKVILDLQNGLVEIYQRRQHVKLLLVTIAIWFCINTNFYLITLSLGYQLSYFQVIVITIIMIPMTLLPFQGFANLGTHEIGWVVAFSIFGQTEDVALKIAFSSHVILLFFVIFLGVCSFPIIYLTKKPQSIKAIND